MLRLTLQSARAAEWDAMIGALDSAAVCIIDSFDACETSTMMPRRFISATTCLPSGDNAIPLPAVALAGVRIGELIVAVVRERQIARAAIVEFLDAGDILAERVAVLDAHESDFFTLRVDSANVGGGERQFNLAPERSHR